MFTGIIQNRAVVIYKKPAGGQVRFGFRFLKSEKRKIEAGESIAVSGVCLTVSKILRQGFEADVVSETLKATTLAQLNPGGNVNIERALRYGDPMGGHFVTGHVDNIGRILKIEKKGKNRVYYFQIPRELEKLVAPKGSIVVDGVSLTVQDVKGLTFKIALVPHTLRATNFAGKKAGDLVNLEADLVARYLRHLNELSRYAGKRSKHKINDQNS